MTYTITPSSDISYLAFGSCNYTGAPVVTTFTEYFVYDNFCVPQNPVCDVTDTTADCDGDGVLNGVDCDAADPMVAYAPGDACDAGTGPGSGVYDASCNCGAPCNLPAPILYNN